MTLFQRHCMLQYMCTSVFILTSFAVLAQSDPSGEKRITGTYAITNATIYTSPDLIIQGTIIIKDGLIEGVGKKIKIPNEAQEIKGDSLFVYPGFIDVAGNSGVDMPQTPERPQNFDPSNPSPIFAGITPQAEVLDEFDAENEEIDDWRKVGFTISQLVPKGDGMLPGKTAIVLFGNKSSSNILATSTGLYAQFQTIHGIYPGTTLGIMAKWRDLYQNAELIAKHQSVFNNNSGIYPPEIDPVLAGFKPVINNEIPVIFRISHELEIRSALRLQKEKGFQIILTGVDDGANLIPIIREANAGVVLSLDLPKNKASKRKLEGASEDAREKLDRVKEAYKNALQLASEFEKAGVEFAFGTHSSKSSDFIKNLQLMVESGLSEKAALAALTINAARILKIEKISGSIEKGKLANLVITTDSLFKKGSQIKFVFAGGYQHVYEIKSKDKNGKDKEDLLSGTWNYSAETTEGSSSGLMTISKGPESYQGTITYDDPEGGGTKSTEMKNLEWSGDILKFDFDVNVKGMYISVSVTGEISGMEYEGKLSITDLGDFPFRATRSPETFIN